jgi:transforming growth factor-beta-induced protein
LFINDSCKAEIACSNQDFSTLCTAITAAGLGTVLSGGSWTVFAPTNAAFQNLGADLLNAALDDKELLTTILLNHAVDEKLLAKDLVCSSLVEMAGGEDTRTVCMRNGTVIYQKGGSNSRDKMPRVVTTNMAACNGLIHVVGTYRSSVR